MSLLLGTRTSNPGPEYMLRSEPSTRATNTDPLCTFGPRYTFTNLSEREGSQKMFASQLPSGMGSGYGRDTALDHPGPGAYNPKLLRSGRTDGPLGQSLTLSFKSSGPYSAYGRPGHTKWVSKAHASVENHSIFSPSPQYYDVARSHNDRFGQGRTESGAISGPGSVAYTMRPRLESQMDLNRTSSNPGPGTYHPEVTRDGVHVDFTQLEHKPPIGTAKQRVRAEESRASVKFLGKGHMEEFRGTQGCGPIYNPSVNAIGAEKGKVGFTFGASSRFPEPASWHWS